MNQQFPHFDPMAPIVQSKGIPRDPEFLLEHIIKLFPLRLPTMDELRGNPNETYVRIGEQNVINVCRQILERLRK